MRPGHHLIDHGFGFFRDPVDDVIDADGLRDVVNEKEQQSDADRRQRHGAQDGGHRRERVGSERAVGSAAMQYEKVPRKIPSVHCVTRSLEKLTMMRGENCMEASVSVISRMANTMDTTVMMEAAMPARMTWATCGSACDGNRARAPRR